MQNYQSSENEHNDAIIIDVKTIVNNIWRCVSHFWWLMLLILIVCAIGITALGRWNYKAVYRSSFAFIVNKTGDTSLDSTAAAYLGGSFDEVLNNAGLRQEVSDTLELNGSPRLTESIYASSMDSLNMVTVSAEASSYKRAKEIIDIIKEVYPDYASKVMGTVKISEVDTALDVTAPINEFVYVQYAAVGVVLGLLICMIIIFFHAVSRKTIQSKRDVEKISNLHCLIELPDMGLKRKTKKNQVDKFEYDNFKKAMRALCFRISQKRRESVTIMLTGSVEGEGTSLISTEMGKRFGSFKHKTVIVNMSNLNHIKLDKALLEKKGIKEVGELKKINDINFYVDVKKQNYSYLLPMPSSANGNGKGVFELMTDKDMEELFTYLRKKYEYIIIDAPPTTKNVDTMILGQYIDKIIYVVRQGFTTEKALAEGIDNIQNNNQEIWGFILNGANSGIYGDGKYGKYSSYGYSKYYREENNA